jgi:hypothetical protein
VSGPAYTAQDVQDCLAAASQGYSGLAEVHWRIAALPVIQAVLGYLAEQRRLLPPPQWCQACHAPMATGHCTHAVVHNGQVSIAHAEWLRLLEQVAALRTLDGGGGHV